eukprot:TRINITY_DN102731_c0_g1_i1.p1 TRINITY_DN102731_c0_g1~~TRINITY_DN102731_c0_g1_i1.p1  ORF type:complete len:276 (-),score=18.38 TRINITY_DN102731_c0_g1_i1:13-840(-)
MALAVAADIFDGAVVGAGVKFFMIPLECVVTPLSSRSDMAQGGVRTVVQTIFRSQGLAGFWKGAAVDVCRGGLNRGLTIGLFDTFRRTWGVPDGLAGLLTGGTVGFITYPLEVVQTGRRSHIGDCPKILGATSLRSMATKGVQGLYPALLPSMLGISGFWAVSFACKQPIMDVTGSPFVSGFVGSAVAFALFQWNNVVRLTMQRRAIEGLPHVSWSETLRKEYRQGGIRRLYSGSSVRLFQTGLTVGLLFCIYDRMHVFRHLYTLQSESKLHERR